MAVEVAGLAEIVRQAKLAISQASASGARMQASAQRLTDTLKQVDDMTQQLDAAHAQLQAAVGQLTNGGPPLDPPPASEGMTAEGAKKVVEAANKS